MRSIAISVSVGPYVIMSVCPLSYLKNYTFKLAEIFCTRYLWLSVPPSFSDDTLSTSGFVDDVMSSRNEPNTDTGLKSKGIELFTIIIIIEIYSAPLRLLHGEHRCIMRVINSRQQ